jgi:glycosyltransferase involved in cell wall biosynthesis
MRIAIQAADLDAGRIDGTRVYLLRLLERFGTAFPEHAWHLYHRRSFNPDLAPPTLPNYTVHTVPFPFFWTQTRFSLEILRQKPERVFMPVQALPFFAPRKTESIVTIHDLAFKIFPEHFPSRDLRRLNWFTNFAIRNASRLIAVSEATKRDILKFYPTVNEEKIRVIHHGFDVSPIISERETEEALKKFNLVSGEYILYVGALQPRKNLTRLMEAFGSLTRKYPSAKLVLAGEAAWMSEEIVHARATHPYRDRIVLAGRVSFTDRARLYHGARIFVFPSLYEGFGLPILEAFAAGVPVLCANNSSLPEVAGDAARLFDATKTDELAQNLLELWENETERTSLIGRGKEQLKKFSWDICARKTAEWILQ